MPATLDTLTYGCSERSRLFPDCTILIRGSGSRPLVIGSLTMGLFLLVRWVDVCVITLLAMGAWGFYRGDPFWCSPG